MAIGGALDVKDAAVDLSLSLNDLVHTKRANSRVTRDLQLVLASCCKLVVVSACEGS